MSSSAPRPPGPPRWRWHRGLARRGGGGLLLWGAQRDAGSRLAAVLCRHAPWLLPARRLATTPHVIAIRHPRAEARDHVVLVVREPLRDLDALLTAQRTALLQEFIDTARMLARDRDGEERLLAINLGPRQQVAHLHAHLLPLRGLRYALDQVVERRRVDLGDPSAVEATARTLVDRLHDEGGNRGGSLLIRDLAGERPEFAISVAGADHAPRRWAGVRH